MQKMFAAVLCMSITGQAQQRPIVCPAAGGGYLPVQWSPQYTAYIPGDRLDGPVPCLWGYFPSTVLYKADGSPDIGDGWPVQSARVYQNFFLTGSFNNGFQSAPGYSTGPVNDTGPTRSYGRFSPFNGTVFGNGDEDGVRLDCFLWHNAGKATTDAMSGTVIRSGPTNESGEVFFTGRSSNPLESDAARIRWNVRVTMDGSNPLNVRVTQVAFDHSCFPAHNVKVQGYTVCHYVPPRTDTIYVTSCLLFQNDPVVGQRTVNRQVPCQ